MCPPGTHMTAHCTASTNTQCKACSVDHYTELWNYLPRCLYCDNFCFGNLEVETECSDKSNRVCRCKEGFYLTSDYCARHSECGPGNGVQSRGTPLTNTVCEECSDGYFSNSSSALDSCVKHQECATGKAALLPGSIYHDTVCGSCEDLTYGGETYKAFLSGLFNEHKTRVGKMRKFAARYITKSGTERRISRMALVSQRGPLLDQIIEGLAKAPELLTQLPQMLRSSQLNSLAEKLETKLKEIKEQSPSCNVTQ